MRLSKCTAANLPNIVIAKQLFVRIPMGKHSARVVIALERRLSCFCILRGSARGILLERRRSDHAELLPVGR